MSVALASCSVYNMESVTANPPFCMSNLPYDYGPLCMRYCVHIHILCATLDNPTKQPSLHSDLCVYGTKVSYRAQLAFLLGWHTQQ